MADQANRKAASWKMLVGMEVHVQLATESKMFTGARNGFGGEPNTQVDEQVLGLPGVLPVLNEKAVDYAIRLGLALGCQIAKYTKWDRKNYYYPDLPKNYQISQYDMPVCGPGSMVVPMPQGGIPLRIRRAHLEEDAGKLMHEAPGGFPIAHSIVDLNRAGSPLLEIVTEPDLSNAEEVVAFAEELAHLVRYLGISHGQMQMGHLRFEPNINLHITDAQGVVHKTAITEIKNINSFATLEKATRYEGHRQLQHWLDTGELGRKSTYGWDDNTGTTFLQREKEEANDYRYFPDPDLVAVVISDEWIERVRSQIGELPVQRLARYIALGLPTADAENILDDRRTADYFDAAVAAGAEPRRAANLMLGHLKRLANARQAAIPDLGLSHAKLAEVAKLIAGDKLAASAAGQVIEALLESDLPAEEVAAKLGLVQVSDTSQIDEVVDALLAENPKPVQDYRGGKQAALGAIVGMAMKRAKGLNPKLVQETIRRKIGPA